MESLGDMFPIFGPLTKEAAQSMNSLLKTVSSVFPSGTAPSKLLERMSGVLPSQTVPSKFLETMSGVLPSRRPAPSKQLKTRSGILPSRTKPSAAELTELKQAMNAMRCTVVPVCNATMQCRPVYTIKEETKSEEDSAAEHNTM